MCPDSFWWLSPLWLPPSWLACGRDTCLCPTLLYTNARRHLLYTTRHLKFGRADRTATQHRNHRLRGSKQLGKERINWALEHFPPSGFLSSPGWGSPACVCPPRKGSLSLLSSFRLLPLPTPQCQETLFSCGPFARPVGPLSVILSHLNRSRQSCRPELPESCTRRGIFLLGQTGRALFPPAAGPKALGAPWLNSSRGSPCPHLCMQHNVSDGAGEPFPLLALSYKLPVL